MDTVMAKALRSFEFEGAVVTRKTQPFPVAKRVFNQLEAQRLVEEVPIEAPKQAGGEKSSASPPGQASPKQTAKPSGNGGQKKQTTRKASSARTQRSG